MALRTHIFVSPNTLPHPLKTQSLPLLTTTPTTNHFPYKPKTQTACCASKNNNTNTNTASGDDADLASDLATEVAKLSTQMAQKEDAMKKSKQLLFSEFCNHLGQQKEEVKAKWRQMGEEEKWVLVKGFVDVWGANFQPLSVRSAKELIEEYLQEEKPALEDDDDDDSSSISSVLFPGLKRVMGFYA